MDARRVTHCVRRLTSVANSYPITPPAMAIRNMAIRNWDTQIWPKSLVSLSLYITNKSEFGSGWPKLFLIAVVGGVIRTYLSWQLHICVPFASHICIANVNELQPGCTWNTHIQTSMGRTRSAHIPREHQWNTNAKPIKSFNDNWTSRDMGPETSVAYKIPATVFDYWRCTCLHQNCTALHLFRVEGLGVLTKFLQW